MDSTRYQVSIENAQQFLTEIELPMFPEELFKLQKLLDEHDVPHLKAVAEIISRNPYLAAEIVSLANIPIFNPKLIHIADLDSAIFILGIQNIKDYVTSIHIQQKFLDNSFHGLNLHCKNIALICSALAKHTNSLPTSQAYFLGLIHDIGTFAIHQIDANYGLIFEGTNMQFKVSNEKEFKRYGTSHSAMGYIMSKELRLSKEVSLAILLHHDTHPKRIKNANIRTRVALLALSHLISIQIKKDNVSFTDEQSEVYEACCQILNITEDVIKKVHNQVN